MNINVTIAGKTYAVKIEDIHARPVKAEVNGQVFEVWPEETAAQSVQAQPVPIATPAVKPAAATSQPAASMQEVRSPLPGVIVEIKVKPGDVVKTGQPLCTLEAMKMKNVIRAGKDGTVAEVHIKVGDQVQHNQLMFTYEG
jgi:biotin carboxyl carrier protein